MTPFKNRKIDPSKPVMVYRNLHGESFSLLQGNLVVAHAQTLALRHCNMVVRQHGYETFLRTKRKNVHAFVKGYLSQDQEPDNTVPVRYNPTKGNKFTTTKGDVVLTASGLWLDYPSVKMEAGND